MLVRRASVPQVPYACRDEWWAACARAIVACCRSIQEHVAAVRHRACFTQGLAWTEYDALMLGSFDGTRLHRDCFEVMLRCTKDRGVGWCHKISTAVTRAATRALETHLAHRGTHFCVPQDACCCLAVIVRKMQCFVTDVLVEAAFLKLLTVSFVYTATDVLWPRHRLGDVRLAVYMALHARLGRESPLHRLDTDTLRIITAMCGIEPHSLAAHSRAAAQHGHVPGPARAAGAALVEVGGFGRRGPW